jgi:trigger factor
MNVTSEKLENSTAKMTITIPADEFKKAVTAAYNKEKGRYNVQGFRRGHAPQAFIEKMYGEGVFFETAANSIIDSSYPDVVEQSDLDIVSRPEIEVTQIESGKDFIYTALVAVRPEVKLGTYKGVKITKADETVTDEDVDASIAKEQDRNSRLVSAEGKAAENGDTTVIDFDGSIDGVAFDGGKGEEYSLVLGSGSFIPGFEDQLVGHKAGEHVDVNVTFPDDYHAKDLAGKAAVFAVDIKEVKTKELPALDDEFASEVSEFDTMEEYRADVRKKLEETKKESAKYANENAAVDAAVAAAEVELPELMVSTRVDDNLNDNARRMRAQGISLADYMKYTNTTLDQLREQLRPEAERSLKMSLVLEAVANAENIEISAEELDAEIKKQAENYKMSEDDVKNYFNDAVKENMRQNLRIQKAVELIADAAVTE